MPKGTRVARKPAPLSAQKAGPDLAGVLAKKDAFLREILHQIKNHLQVVASLIGLQAEGVTDKRLLRLLKDAQNRVRAISLVYEKLYQAGAATRIDFADYVQALVIHLAHIMETDLNRVRIRLDLRRSPLDIRTAVPCGLIANELVANALQHAFPGARKGTLLVSLRPLATRKFRLVVADDGIGCPVRVDPRTARTLGLQIVSMLTTQVEGSLLLKRGKGTRFEVVFRQLEYNSRI
jgi:two-component sensor histidine kinase